MCIFKNDAKTALELLSHIRGFESGKVPAAYTNMKVSTRVIVVHLCSFHVQAVGSLILISKSDH